MRPPENRSRDTIRVNEVIRWSPIMLIDQDGNNCGTLPTRKALDMARQVGLDLVEVSPNTRPPVCKIMDYGKYKFEQSKKIKKPKEAELKELQFRPNIDENDIVTKIKSVRKFLEAGDRVLVKVRFVKRENAHKELGFVLIQRIIDTVAEIGIPQSSPSLSDRSIVCTINPVKQ
jgi:translation initiation factor IF-3